MIGNPLLLPTEGYEISRSVRTRGAYPATPSYFSRTAGTPTNNLKWTFSFWAKRGVLSVGQQILNAGTGTSASEDYLTFLGSNKLAFYQGNGTTTVIATNAVFRDPSAWYHIVLVYDSAQATASNRLFIYVNGVSQSFSSATYPTLNQATNINSNGVLQRISSRTYLADEGFDGYLTETNFIDGQALTPSSFGETDATTGVWKPKKYTGTYGTNGFYLNFSDNSAATAAAIGKDYSGNGNNWTPNNISVTAGSTYDSMLDVPTLWADGGNGRGNYAVLNPLDVSLAVATIANGNLQHTGASAVNRWSRSSIQIPSDKYYWEVTTITAVAQRGVQLVHGSTYSQYISTGVIEINGASVGSGFATWTANDVIGVALDRDNNTVAFYKNGTLIYTGTSLSAGNVIPQLNSASTDVLSINFGQRPFAYTPPTGFKALNTQNLPAPTILKGNQYFDVSLYTGNATARSITGVGFRPDFVWTKSRSGAESHRLYDAVRGTTQSLYSNLTNAEATEAQSLTAFNSDGFSLGTGAPNSNAVTYAAWQWKESVSAGFDIVTYTGNATARTLAHSCGSAPKLMIVKSRSAVQAWVAYHASLGTGKVMVLNGTNAVQSLANYWDTAPDSSNFYLGSNADVNGNGTTFVAYLFSEVAGFSRFGSYTGNGSTDGPFVFCGFRPAFIMIKRTDTTGNWTIHDNRRSGYNGSSASKELYPNLSNAEGSDSMDQLSNGFKLRDTYSDVNASGGTYIFMALAESPFRTSLAR